jgi:hypothetical protein
MKKKKEKRMTYENNAHMAPNTVAEAVPSTNYFKYLSP